MLPPKEKQFVIPNDGYIAAITSMSQLKKYIAQETVISILNRYANE